MFPSTSVWAPLSGTAGKCELGSSQRCWTGTSRRVGTSGRPRGALQEGGESWDVVHASLLGSAGDSDDQALPKGLSLLCFVWSRCLTSQPARGSFMSRLYLIGKLTAGRGRLCKHSVSLRARQLSWPLASVCLGGSSGCYVDTFFYLFNETSFLPFQRSGGFDVMCWWVTAFNRPASRDWECCLEQLLC